MTYDFRHSSTKISMKKSKQILVWMAPLGGDREMATRVVDFDQKPTRMWTLYPYTDERHPPELPYQPQHLKNAFLEDRVHDWDWKNGKLRYYSRVVGAQEGVWLLLEF